MAIEGSSSTVEAENRGTARWGQFSIRGLLLLTGLIGLLLALPTEVSFALAWFTTALVIPVSIVVLVWGHAADRAFAIGALFGVLAWLYLREDFGVSIRAERDPLVYWALAWGWIAAAGVICRQARKVALRRAKV